MWQSIRHWLKRRIINRSTVTPSQWSEALASLQLLAGLSADEITRLQELAILLLHDKNFEGARGLVITREMQLIIALQACLPVLNLGLGGYSGWVSVIVYPSGFAPERIETDEYGVQHSRRTDLSGESWQRGPVVLAWDAAEQGGIIDGHNLVIHEFAHKLDMQNGKANGFPPLHSGMATTAWVEAFSAGFDDFQQQCHHGNRIGIDCYAATSPAEFFAVLSEVFFERPDVLQHHYAAIYDQLRLYYRQGTRCCA